MSTRIFQKVARVRTGFVISFSRPGKSWILIMGQGKLKIIENYVYGEKSLIQHSFREYKGRR